MKYRRPAFQKGLRLLATPIGGSVSAVTSSGGTTPSDAGEGRILARQKAVQFLTFLASKTPLF